MTFYFGWEVWLIEFLQERFGGFFDAAAGVLDFLGGEAAMILIVGFMYWSLNKDFARRMAVGMVIGVMLNPMIKNVVMRRRPYFDHPGVRCIRPAREGDIYDVELQGYSFPSLHATDTVLSFGTLLTYKRRLWLRVLCVATPFVVGVSRFCLGVHYPTDVLAGWALGAAAVILGPRLEAAVKNKAILYGALVLAALPGWFYCESEDFYAAFGLMVGSFAAFLFDERFVRFANTRAPLRMILRPLGGVAVFVALNLLFKALFSLCPADAPVVAVRALRSARYAVTSFAVIGVYPMLFSHTDRFFNKKEISG